ncbi:phosphoribosyltransferase [Ralstonia solanacearum]|uniref:Uncharacterized protein n=1 Tax=Ralstonia solanacearum (strain Po82) TaxID=1031711 RepID=F6G741_RALS8|nr:phosphoribosyltransferase [Ralstonia solanacearum]AEG70705.1 conserved hypothetical protein [Ralstonia solanacearum Po82]MBB6588149.1 phosphoribosyltransferase [Ralstonia solanacearum]MCG3575042.1 phosphoribosyltransferase [Ralstonia solanacearum]MCL9824136.1 phosphoribosyltransferase [Ralstonia solanacearum]MCL9829354.1 phosphoribosyltransferase [Ralstonia solanacearum]
MTLAFSDIIAETSADFDHAVAQIESANLRQASGIVLRAHASLWRQVVQVGFDTTLLERDLDAVLRRAPGLDVYLLPDAHSLAKLRAVKSGVRSPIQLIDGASGKKIVSEVDANCLDRIRFAELKGLFESFKGRCVICASANYHFALPSGAHASQFVRLGDAFASIETVDRIAYWVAMEIQSRSATLEKSGRHTVFVDHPSMLILAARVQQLVGVAVEIVAFPTYPSDVESRKASFDMLSGYAKECASVFVVIGVASTGRLAEFIQKWGDTEFPNATSVIVLYALQEIKVPSVLCQLELDGYRHFPDKGSCDLCAVESAAVQIHTSSYLVGVQPADAIPLTQEHFDKQRDFLQRWGAFPGVLRVHYDDPNEATGRHHAYYIDVGSLLEAPGFREKLHAACTQFNPKADVIVIPDHPTARKLGEILSDFLGMPLVVLDETLIARGEGPVDENLRSSQCALIVDDVFITGSRLESVNRFLRERCAERAPNLQTIRYWTVLATPSSPTGYQRVVRGMTQNHKWSSSVSHWQEIPLPDWHHADDCPWCMEQNVLSGLAQSIVEFDGPISQRLAALHSTTQGVAASPFVTTENGLPIPLLGANAVALAEGSNAMQVLFACASAAQQLRNAPKKALNADQFPTPRYVARRVLENNYTERLLWLALLRSLKGKELDPALKVFLAEAALDAEDGQHGIISGELAVAWLTGKLGAIPVSVPCREFFSGAGISWDALYATAFVDRYPQ